MAVAELVWLCVDLCGCSRVCGWYLQLLVCTCVRTAAQPHPSLHSCGVVGTWLCAYACPVIRLTVAASEAV